MSECTVCGDDERLEFVCKLCGRSHCPDHQLPENHGCPGLETYERNPSWFHTTEATVEGGTERARRFQRRAPEALERRDIGHLPGTTAEPKYDSGPDVATDGSAVSSPEPVNDPASANNSTGRRLRWSIDTRLERYRDRPSALLVDVAYLAVLFLLAGLVYLAVTSFLL